MSSEWKSNYDERIYNSFHDEEICKDIRRICCCYINGIEFLITVIGNSICIEEMNTTKIGATSSVDRVMIAGSQIARPGYQDGPGLECRFNDISDICVDVDNILIICDTGNNVVRMMDLIPPYTVVTICGCIQSLTPELSAIRFRRLRGVCVDNLNNIYVCDGGSNIISKIDDKRETIVNFFDNSMVDSLYYGDINNKKYCLLKSPTKIKIQQNRNLIILNGGAVSICKVSLYPSTSNNNRWCSVVKYGFDNIYTLAVAKNGDIIVCKEKVDNTLAFYKILPNRQQILLSDKATNNSKLVWELLIRQNDNSDRLCFFTIDHVIGNDYSKIVQTKMMMRWSFLRILFIACFKTELDDDEDSTKTFELLPVIGRSGKYSPILRMIIEFVNQIL